ncbi:hypothetical protein HJG60_009056 [Phyllostomus discolor]|uniref:Peptidase S1 domain-containing protein n=1 Tax=Phyllostomus discolor TaxID=89673 RepID=A0A833YS55_9CHIR|nr:hypothetical protein HJG60_009056 [Phyllostomus discolor]
MAGPHLSPLLILLLSLALGAAGLEDEANNTEEKIVNRSPCPRGKQLWQVALLYDNEFHCSDVLVSKQWVLTVTQCHLRVYIVQMGSDLLLDAELLETKATESFIHPQYNYVTLTHDIMLVKLHSPAQLSPTTTLHGIAHFNLIKQ